MGRGSIFNGNGNGDNTVRLPRWIVWVVGISLPVILGAVMTWAASIDARTHCNQSDISALNEHRRNVITSFDHFNKRLQAFDEKIDKVSDKIDRIYELQMQGE